MLHGALSGVRRSVVADEGGARCTRYSLRRCILAQGGSRAEHIEDLWWLSPADGVSNTMSTAQAVEWLRQPERRALVGGQNGPVRVEVVNANPPYLRTQADATVRDNLLQLPRY